MKPKKILLIEDFVNQRLAFEEFLEGRGFEVISPGTADEAHKLTAQHWEEIAVALIDMRLDKWNESNLTGAKILLDVRADKQAEKIYRMPEVIVLSAYAEIEFYRLALDLRVAAYILKNEDNTNKLPSAPVTGSSLEFGDDQFFQNPELVERNYKKVINHVRALTLRHSLQPERPEIESAISRLAATSLSQAEAVIRFCKEILAPELEICLGAPFFILFTNEGRTEMFCGPSEFPSGYHDFYHTLQAIAHSQGNSIEALESERLKREAPSSKVTNEMYEILNGAAFVPLTVNNELRLSLGVIQEKVSDVVPIPENAESLCRVLSQHLKPTLIEHIINILSQWNKLRTMMHNTSQLCLLFGQEQKKILQKIKDSSELPLVSSQLQTLADDLYATGEILNYIGFSTDIVSSDSSESVAEIVKERWAEVSGEKLAESLQIEGNCYVQVDFDDLYLIVTRLLQWFVRRANETPSALESMVRVRCSETEDWCEIVFEDSSFRLSPRLRAELFLPFSQAISLPFEDTTALFEDKISNAGLYLPLYLTKMLVEGKYRGWVEDRSEDIEGPFGNRILVRFPKLRPKSENFERKAEESMTSA